MAGKQITITLPGYTVGQLEGLAEKKNLKKSVVITLALERFAREEEKAERVEKLEWERRAQ